MSPSILSPVHTIVRTVLDESHRTVMAATGRSQYNALTIPFLPINDVNSQRKKRELAFGLAIGAEEWGITDYSIKLSFQFG